MVTWIRAVRAQLNAARLMPKLRAAVGSACDVRRRWAGPSLGVFTVTSGKCGGDAGETLRVGNGVTDFLLGLGVGVCPAAAESHVV